MLKYTLQRIITFIPMLIAISLIAFIISINAPGDPVERLAKAAGSEGGVDQESGASKKIKQELRKKLGLDLPIFYISISDIAITDTLYKIQDKYHKANLKELTHQSGNWQVVSDYYHSLLNLQEKQKEIKLKDILLEEGESLTDIKEVSNQFGFEIGSLLETARPEVVQVKMEKMDKLLAENAVLSVLAEDYSQAKNNYQNLSLLATKWKNYIPSIKWYGGDNQYHLWLFGNMSYYPVKTFASIKTSFSTNTDAEVLSSICKVKTPDFYEEYINSNEYKSLLQFEEDSLIDADTIYNTLYNNNITKLKDYTNTIKHSNGSLERMYREGVLRGDFGISYIDGQEISTKIWDKIWISFALALISIIIAYLVSIPIGIYSAYKKDSAIDKGMSFVLFILYSMPSFFVGILLLLAFANPDNLSWFPVSGIQDPSTFNPDWSIWQKAKHRLPYLILPIITYTYGSFAFLSRIMRIGMIDVVSQDYVRTARAKGLAEKKVILKHALRNSLLPIITVFAAIFPMAIGGSVIIEVIFSIPGMGLEVYNAILNYDYPMIITFFTLSGFLLMVGYLVSDVLYALVDPRISYK